MKHYPPEELPKQDQPLSKVLLRKQAQTWRTNLPMQAISAAIVRHLADSSLFQAAGQVAIYHPFRGEVDLLALVPAHPSKRWFLPRVHPDGEMAFYRYTPETPLQAGKYGVQEPPATPETLFQAEAGDLLICPGLCFDRAGYRLGYGKGYYDRFISAMRPRCQLLGVVPQALLLDSLPIDRWDLPMQAVMTEAGCFRPASSSPPD